jgi:radical SAM superfamily enzyme YgiQ (UPF0313 family)
MTAKKELILILPSTSHPVIRLALTFFYNAPATFSLFILPALTPKDYTIKIYNQKLFWLKRDFVSGSLVGISCATSNSYEAYKIADRFRKAGSVVVMGGLHSSYYPKEALEHCDSVVIGEAESVWPGLVRDHENKSLQRIYQGAPVEDYFSLSYEYFLKIDPRILYKTGLLLSRGCKYRCDFCVPHSGGLRLIKLDQTLALVKNIRDSVKLPFGLKPTIIFRDDNIYSSPEYAKKLFLGLAPMRLNWTGNSSIDIAFDNEALKLAKASGCKSLFIGFETIYPQRLQKTSTGHMRSTNDYIKAIKNIKSYGIKVIGAFILGFDHYTHKDYLRLMWFLIRSGLYSISLTILTPFPASQLFERLKSENRITTFDWRKYDSLHHVVFRPKHMSALSLSLWFIVTRIVGLLASPYFIIMTLQVLACFYLTFYFTNLLKGRLF